MRDGISRDGGHAREEVDVEKFNTKSSQQSTDKLAFLIYQKASPCDAVRKAYLRQKGWIQHIANQIAPTVTGSIVHINRQMTVPREAFPLLQLDIFSPVGELIR